MNFKPLEMWGARAVAWGSKPENQKTVHRLVTLALTVWTSLKAGGVL